MSGKGKKGKKVKKSKDAKGKDAKGKDAKGKDAKGKDAKGKDAKGKDAKGKGAKGKDAKGNDAKGNDAKGKDAKGKDAKGKDAKSKEPKSKENKPDVKKDDKNKKTKKEPVADVKKKEENMEEKVKAEDVKEKEKDSKGKRKKTIKKGSKDAEESEGNKNETKEQEVESVTKTDNIVLETQLVTISPKALNLNESLDEKVYPYESSSILVNRYEDGSSLKSLYNLFNKENEDFGPIDDQLLKMSKKKSLKSAQSKGSIKFLDEDKSNEFSPTSEIFNINFPNDVSEWENIAKSYYPATADTMDRANEQVRLDRLPSPIINKNIDEIKTFDRPNDVQYDSQKENVYPANISVKQGNSTLYTTESKEISPNETRYYPTDSIPYPAEPRLYPAESRLHQGESRLHQAESRLHQGESRLHQAESTAYPPQSMLYHVESRIYPDEPLLHPAEARLFPDESTLQPAEARLFPDESILQPTEARLFLDKGAEKEPLGTTSDASTTTSNETFSSNISNSELIGRTDETTSDSVESGVSSMNRLLSGEKFDQSTMTESEVESSTKERDMSLLSEPTEESNQSTSTDDSKGGEQSDESDTWVRLKKDEDQYFKRGRTKLTTVKNAVSNKEIRRETGAFQEINSAENDATPDKLTNYPVDYENKSKPNHRGYMKDSAKWASPMYASPDDGESVSEAESLTDQKSSPSKKRGKKKSKRRLETPISEQAPSSASISSSPVDKRNDDVIIAVLETTQTSSANITKATNEMRDAINRLSQLLNSMNLSIRNLATGNTGNTNDKLSREESRYEVAAPPTGKRNVAAAGYMYMETQYVEVKVVFIRIMDIDTLNQNYEAEIYIQARWAESQFAGLSEQQLEEIEFSKCWNPCLKILNATGSIESERTSMLLQYEPDRVYPVLTYMWQVRGIFREHLELQHFPFDVQELSVVISSDLTMKEVELISDFFHPSHVNSRALQESQDWVAYQHIEFARDFSTLNLMGKTKHPIISASAHVKRRLGFYFWNVTIIVLLIIGLSICVLAIEPSSTDRLGLLLTLFLTAVAFKLVVKTTLPTISYLTYLDIYIVFTLIYLALQAAVSAIMINLAKYRDRSHILLYDEIAQSLLIALLILFHLVFLIYIQLTALRRRRQMKHKDREFLLSRVRKQGPFYPPTEKQTQTSISVEQKAGDGIRLK